MEWTANGGKLKKESYSKKKLQKKSRKFMRKEKQRYLINYPLSFL